MNRPVVEGSEEVKGGSQDVGKLLFSAGMQQLGYVAYVPAGNTKVNAKTWIEKIFESFGGHGEFVGTPTANLAVAISKKTDNQFPLKLKDSGISASVTYLKSIGAFPDKDDSSEEMVFGDDDFPC